MDAAKAKNDEGTFQLFLFSTREDMIVQADEGGVAGFVVDWENKAKTERQTGFDTQINYDTVEDLERVRSLTNRLVICRVNRHKDEQDCRREMNFAIDAGADEILLPMVRSVGEVEMALRLAGDRCGVGILVETRDAVELARELGQLPLTRVYVGLNDLAIDRKKENIFDSLEDGVIDSIRRFFPMPFGFAGLTIPEGGHPIPCRLLMSEMARLRCDFTFLRRAFFADTKDRDMAHELGRIREAVSKTFHDSDKLLAARHSDIQAVIRNCGPFFRAVLGGSS